MELTYLNLRDSIGILLCNSKELISNENGSILNSRNSMELTCTQKTLDNSFKFKETLLNSKEPILTSKLYIFNCLFR